jgi:hypothetical protein
VVEWGSKDFMSESGVEKGVALALKQEVLKGSPFSGQDASWDSSHFPLEAVWPTC